MRREGATIATRSFRICGKPFPKNSSTHRMGARLAPPVGARGGWYSSCCPSPRSNISRNAGTLRMSEAKTKIGIVGAGMVTSGSHLPVLVNMPEVTVAWVCDRAIAAASAVAKTYGIPGAFADVRECPDVDAVLVATPVGSRHAVVPAVLARGWHAFCEKPFALTLADHQRYVRDARAR